VVALDDVLSHLMHKVGQHVPLYLHVKATVGFQAKWSGLGISRIGNVALGNLFLLKNLKRLVPLLKWKSS